MAGTIGNQNAKGNKGGGRKSKYQEMQDATFLWDIFLNQYSTEEIKAKLRKGKFSVKDVWISKLVGGNERLLSMLIQKLFPDRFVGTADITVGITNYKPLSDKERENYDDEFNQAKTEDTDKSGD